MSPCFCFNCCTSDTSKPGIKLGVVGETVFFFFLRDRNIAHKSCLGLSSWKLFLHLPAVIRMSTKYLLFGVIVNDLNLAQKARHSVWSSLLGLWETTERWERSKSDTWLAVSWGYCLFYCWVESRTCKWWTWPFGWSDFQAKCGGASLAFPPSAYSERQEESGCSDTSRSWGCSSPRSPEEARKQPPWEPSEARLCQHLEFELPELGGNKCLSFKLHNESESCSVIFHSLGPHGL